MIKECKVIGRECSVKCIRKKDSRSMIFSRNRVRHLDQMSVVVLERESLPGLRVELFVPNTCQRTQIYNTNRELAKQIWMFYKGRDRESQRF